MITHPRDSEHLIPRLGAFSQNKPRAEVLRILRIWHRMAHFFAHWLISPLSLFRFYVIMEICFLIRGGFRPRSKTSATCQSKQLIQQKKRVFGKIALSFFHPHDQDTFAQSAWSLNLGTKQEEGSLSIGSRLTDRLAASRRFLVHRSEHVSTLPAAGYHFPAERWAACICRQVKLRDFQSWLLENTFH